MFDIIKKFFMASEDPEKKHDEDQSIHDVYVATCALLIEIGQIDGEFSDDEQNNMVQILRNEYQLPEEYVQEISSHAQQALQQSQDLWQFTNLINRHYNRDDKIRIIEVLWKVIYTDGKLDKHEDYLVHKLSRLLNLQHSELIEAKLKALYPE